MEQQTKGKNNKVKYEEVTTENGHSMFDDGLKKAGLFENLADKKRLAEFLSCSVGMIDKLMTEPGFPYFKIGTLVRFNISEVVAWLQQRRAS